MMPLWIRLINLMILVLIAGFATVSLAQAEEEGIWTDRDGQLLLGSGIQGRDGKVLAARCLEGDVRFYSIPEARIESRFDQDFTQLSQEIVGSVGAGLNLGLIGLRGTLEYLRQVARSSTSMSLMTSIDLKAGQYVFEPNMNQERIAVERSQECGDSFVNVADAGAKLLLSTSLELNDEAVFEQLRRRITIRLLFGLIRRERESIDVLRNEFREAGEMVIRAHQWGGNTQGLSELIGEAGEKRCAFDALDECLDLWQSLMRYSKDQETGFSSSLKADSGTYAIMGLGHASYRSHGF